MTAACRARHQIEVHYQPIVDLRSGMATAVEALARWRDPDGTLRGPETFLGFAEQTDLITEIGEAVRAVAVPQAASWARTHPGPLDLHLNVSPREIDHGLVDTVQRVLEESRLPANRLVLEITESRPIDDVPHAATIVQLVRELGVRIGLDDVGISWSSVDRMRALDLDLIKVDRSFVVDDGSAPRSLVAAIIAYARRRGIQVVAEGVERPEQAQRLLDLGCTRGQGFLFCAPGPADVVTSLLATGRRLGAPARSGD